MVELKEKRLRKSLSEAKNGWQGQKDLNPRHAVLETAALPTELYPYVYYSAAFCLREVSYHIPHPNVKIFLKIVGVAPKM